MEIKRIYFVIFTLCLILFSTSVYNQQNLDEENIKKLLSNETIVQNKDYIKLKKKVVKKFSKTKPTQWGMFIPGVKTQLDTNDKVIALTFDACGNPGSFGYDAELIDFLIKENIPATLFLNSKWIDANLPIVEQLINNPLFEIGNHGTEHKPCSVDGRSAYGIKGTKNVEEVFDEIELNSRKIELLTKKKPKFFRSGTAHYDDVAVKIANYLGYEIVNFTINGDYGATASKEQVMNNLLKAKNGDIILLHMNHPEKETAEGVMLAIPQLKQLGYKFVKLSDYPLK
jgi:peptidoglycan/xylan/chitin deacetylase (PgdA/CDA1 family)